METRANYAIIGLFTISVIAAAFGFVYWFMGSDSGTKRATYRIVFNGSIAGLTKGAPVLFNGIRVGEVNEVKWDDQNSEQAIAWIDIQPDAPVKTDTKASLDVALLSGAAVIALTGGSRDAARLVSEQGKEPPTIVAERGGLASILETARGTADRANTLLDNVNALVTDNRSAIQKAVGDVSSFTDALAKNAPAIDNLLSSVARAADNVGPLTEKLAGLADSATGILATVEPERIRNVIRNVEGVTQTVEEGRANIASFLQEASSLAGRLNEAAPKLDQALSDVNRVISGVDPVKINQTVDSAQRFTAGLAASTDEMQATIRNANAFSAKLDNVLAAVRPETVGNILRSFEGVTGTVDENRAKIAAFIGDASSLAGRLNTAAPKLDQALDGMNRTMAALDPGKVGEAVENTRRFTSGLAASTEDVQSTVRNANQLTAKFNAAADRIDGVLKAAENFLGSAAGQEGKSTFASIRDAMDRFGRASDNLNRRATEIAQGVSRVSGVGARQIEALSTDARRTVNTVGRAARNLEQNPSSVIFGGGRASIPEYSGR
ncbi:MlaD family protein [Enterovirga sp.]|jgi:phospholipid/cholesterol/gamma-HCH transport system substrate-binding protein|uniref:MlaD family protein n=1 Tax=Enterovirga sp. TaxID=2026350 RepID=UPI002635A697|nr:MlaD family protein [Enterovirga sp.]MDB5591763.1 hypothetical protein [Enterovirga sp.]